MKTKSQCSLLIPVSLFVFFAFSCTKDEYQGPPKITTGNIYEITSNSAMVGGNVTSDGGSPVLKKGICWSTHTAPDTTNYKTNNGGGAGTFSSTLADLDLYTTYYVRAYATNAKGINYGTEKSFHTAALPEQIDGIPLNKFDEILSDDFNNNNNGWYTIIDNDAEILVNNGFYDITSLNDGFLWFWGSLNALSPSNNFEIETNLKIIPQGISTDEAGSFIWDVSENNFTGAMLFQSNSMWFGKYTGSWVDWNFYNSLAALNPVGDLNKLTIRKFEDVYYFFVNNQFIFSQNWTPFTAMTFGYMIQAHGKMLIDNIKISQIGSAVKSQINKAAIMQSFKTSYYKGIPYSIKKF